MLVLEPQSATNIFLQRNILKISTSVFSLSAVYIAHKNMNLDAFTFFSKDLYSIYLGEVTNKKLCASFGRRRAKSI
jgi:hypothetical protein